MKTRKFIGKAIVYIILCVGLFVWLFPFYWIIRTSLMERNQILAYPPVWIPSPFAFENYTEGLSILPFARYYMNTVFIVVVNLLGVLFTSTLCAYSFSRLKWPGRDKIFSLLLTSMMLPTAVTMITVFLGWSKLGLVNTYFPLTVPAWFGGGAFFLFLLRQFYLSLPKEYDEAAIVDGASFFKIYTHIMLPLIKPAFVSVAMFCFINNWNDFMSPLIYLSDDSLFTISMGLRTFQGMYNTEYHYMMAATVVSTVPVLLVFLFGQKYIVEGVAMTGIKG